VPKQQQQAQKQQQPPPPTAAALDLESPLFDAAAALAAADDATSRVRVPDPSAPPLDNLSRARKLLPNDHPDSLAHLPAREPASEAGRAKSAALKESARRAVERAAAGGRRAAGGSLPSIMAIATAGGGPISMLARCVGARAPAAAAGAAAQPQPPPPPPPPPPRVAVVTRHATGVRGRAVGTLVAFDMYMNLVMADVEETYTVVVRRPRGGGLAGGSGGDASSSAPANTNNNPNTKPAEQEEGGSEARVRYRRRQETRTRRLGQVFVRGDSLVSVSMLPPS
jgi:small nuclear ribonucleoprotein (snRNP)-like protein